MKIYKIIVSQKAQNDIINITGYIRDVYKQYTTAVRYKEGLYKTIATLAYLADVLGYNEYVQSAFGNNARHITYKKMAIIYVTHGDTVYIKRVIANSMIH
jgi:plasmid stabilization system protein ParE